MDRCFRLWPVLPGLAAATAMALSGCDYSSNTPPSLPGVEAETKSAPGAFPDVPRSSATGEDRGEREVAILDNVVKLIESAATNPGGNNFANATKNLNQYFAGIPSSAYALRPEAREFLKRQQPTEKRVGELEAPTWTMPDARHMEDCMLYHAIATRVGGVGDDLSRVRRVFDWMVRQVQLVPAGSLGAPGLGQAYARPFDVLVRGMATESEGVWSERGWLFLSLCRQLGLDGGLVTYTPRGLKEPIVWCTAILIDKKPYLFDTRVGLPIPDARGDGVATLDQAMADPTILDRMDLPGQSPYGTTRAALLGSSSRIGILIDSGLRYFSPRMKLLQQNLAGKNLTVLFRDPAEQRDRFAEALGDRLGGVALWQLPITVETLLFSSPQFMESTKRAQILFQPEFPLLYARMKQLRGETPEAVQDYVTFRFAENSLMTDKKTPMPREVQQALDVYATYFLGTCHLDQGDARQADFFFEKTLQMLPEPGKGQPYYNMYRWGAQANLARLKEAKGELAKATAFYSLNDPTTQRHGNLLRARDLVWRDPTSPCPAPLPPAPSPAAAPALGIQASAGPRAAR